MNVDKEKRLFLETNQTKRKYLAIFVIKNPVSNFSLRAGATLREQNSLSRDSGKGGKVLYIE